MTTIEALNATGIVYAVQDGPRMLVCDLLVLQWMIGLVREQIRFGRKQLSLWS